MISQQSSQLLENSNSNTYYFSLPTLSSLVTLFDPMVLNLSYWLMTPKCILSAPTSCRSPELHVHLQGDISNCHVTLSMAKMELLSSAYLSQFLPPSVSQQVHVYLPSHLKPKTQESQLVSSRTPKKQLSNPRKYIPTSFSSHHFTGRTLVQRVQASLSLTCIYCESCPPQNILLWKVSSI